MRRLRTHEKYHVKLTLFEAFGSSFKALVGIGILSCPSAFKEVGMGTGVLGNVVVVVVALLMYYQLMKVIEAKSSSECRSLGDITHSILGPWGRTAVELCVLGSNLSVCVAYLRYFGE